MLFRTAHRITLNREDAEDIVQDTLLKLWERRDTLSAIHDLEAFAITAARNLALDRKQLAHAKVVSLDETLHDQQVPSVTESLIQAEKINHIYTLMGQLPEKQRTALQLRDIEGKTYKEIASIMETSEADVKINIYRGRNFLKKNCNFSAAEPS